LPVDRGFIELFHRAVEFVEVHIVFGNFPLCLNVQLRSRGLRFHAIIKVTCAKGIAFLLGQKPLSRRENGLEKVMLTSCTWTCKAATKALMKRIFFINIAL
jgi:hypothetical protein